MVSLSNVLQHSWLTKKRKIMLAALLVFVTCSSAYKWIASGSSDGGSVATNRGPYVRAGGLICNDMASALQLRMQERAGINLAVNGCSQINNNLYVDIRRSENGIVEVSNASGSGWVSEDDIR